MQGVPAASCDVMGVLPPEAFWQCDHEVRLRVASELLGVKALAQ